MYDTKSAEERHVDGHGVFSYSIHGRGDKGSLQGDIAGDGSFESDIGRSETFDSLTLDS